MGSTGESAVSAVNGAIAEGINSVLGTGQGSRKHQRQAARDQYNYQRALNEQAAELNAKSQAQQQANALQQMTAAQKHANAVNAEYNSVTGKMKQLERAGLNPAAAYAVGGGSGGGSGQAATGTAGTSAPSISGGGVGLLDPTNVKRANTEQQMAASQIRLNDALAEKATAEAGSAGATEGLTSEKAETERQMRTGMKAMIEEQGWEVFLKNFMVEQGLLTGVSDPRGKGSDAGDWNMNVVKVSRHNRQLGYLSGQGSYLSEKITNEMLQQYARTETMSQESNKAVWDAAIAEKDFDYYYNRLVNETTRANATGMAAAAYKLQTDYNVGNIWNAKQWVEMGALGVNALGNAVGSVWGAKVGAEKVKQIGKAAEEAKSKIEWWEKETSVRGGSKFESYRGSR